MATAQGFAIKKLKTCFNIAAKNTSLRQSSPEK